MLTIVKPVYYCEHCKRHRMTAAAIERHEPRCIYNPGRSVCGWHEPHITIPRPADLVPQVKEDADVDWLRTAVNGCPACMLAVVVQCGFTWAERDDLGFDYDREVDAFRAQEERDYAF